MPLTQFTESPRYLRLHEADNVAVIVNGGGVSAGTAFGDGLRVRDSIPQSHKVPPDPPPLEGYTFEGYKNTDGSVGTRNLLGITTTVQCVTGVLDHAVKRIRDEVLPRYPNVRLRLGLAGARQRDGDVLRGHRGPRRRAPAQRPRQGRGRPASIGGCDGRKSVWSRNPPC